MKRLVAVLAVVAVFAAFSGITATAADGPSITQFRHLQRQVNRLDNQVASLQGDVRNLKLDVNDLLYDVFVCTFPGDPLSSFTDGSYAYSLYYDYNCTATFGPDAKPDTAGLDRVQRQS